MEKILSIVILLLMGIISLNGCSSKKITVKEAGNEHFQLKEGYRDDVSKAIVSRLLSDKKNVGRHLLYHGRPSIHGTPIEECRDGIFGISCKYVGKASIVYDVPHLRRFGQVPITLKYRYEIFKNGYVSVFR